MTVLLYICLPLLLLASPPPAGAELYPKGEVFPIGGYSSRPEEDRAAGFTLAGPAYRDSAGLLRKAEEAGIDMVYRIRPSLNVKRVKASSLSAAEKEQMHAEITAQVKAVAESQRIHSWTLSPEELRYWRPHELEYVKLATAAIRAADPQKRPIWMYEPGHRGADALARLLPYFDISAKGSYVNYSGRKDERGWLRLSVGEQAKAISKANPKALLYALPEMFRQPEPEDLDRVALWVRHDVYSSLLAGAEGILIYSFANRRDFTARQLYYDAYAAAARELNGPKQPAMAVLKGQPEAVPAIAHLEGPAQITLSAKPPLERPVQLPALLAKAYYWKGQHYLFIVNSATTSVAFSLPADGWRALDETPLPQHLTLEPWEVVVAYRPGRIESH